MVPWTIFIIQKCLISKVSYSGKSFFWCFKCSSMASLWKPLLESLFVRVKEFGMRNGNVLWMLNFLHGTLNDNKEPLFILLNTLLSLHCNLSMAVNDKNWRGGGLLNAEKYTVISFFVWFVSRCQSADLFLSMYSICYICQIVVQTVLKGLATK